MVRKVYMMKYVLLYTRRYTVAYEYVIGRMRGGDRDYQLSFPVKSHFIVIMQCCQVGYFVVIFPCWAIFGSLP